MYVAAECESDTIYLYLSSLVLFRDRDDSFVCTSSICSALLRACANDLYRSRAERDEGHLHRESRSQGLGRN